MVIFPPWPVFEDITEIWLLIPTTAPVSLIHTVIFPQQLIFRWKYGNVPANVYHIWYVFDSYGDISTTASLWIIYGDVAVQIHHCWYVFDSYGDSFTPASF